MLLSILLLVGCGGTSTSKKTDIPTSSSAMKELGSQKEDSTRKSELKECLAGCEVFQEGNGLLSKGMCIDTCWAEEATIKKDIKLCDKVSADNALIQAGCRIGVAEETLDEKHCATIDDEMMQSGCYMEIAGLKKDSSICENITIGISKALCIDDIENGDGVYEEYTDEVEDYYDEGGY